MAATLGRVTSAPPRDTARSVLGVLGELLITAGVVVGLFAVYTLYWTGVETAHEQDVLAAELDALSSRPGQATTDQEPTGETTQVEPLPEPLRGDAYARMRIPRLGTEWSWVVVEGVDAATLTRGPGHYPDSADPGNVGNFAVAGHRATYGEPFAYLDQVEVGDDVVVERGGMQYRYEVTGSFITVPSDGGVVLPVPGQPGVAPRDRLITLTTCNPRFSGVERLIVHGVLRDSGPVSGEA